MEASDGQRERMYVLLRSLQGPLDACCWDDGRGYGF